MLLKDTAGGGDLKVAKVAGIYIYILIYDVIVVLDLTYSH